MAASHLTSVTMLSSMKKSCSHCGYARTGHYDISISVLLITRTPCLLSSKPLLVCLQDFFNVTEFRRKTFIIAKQHTLLRQFPISVCMLLSG